jgi:hypothetical protein
MEHAIFSETAFGQRLGIVLEGVGGRLGAGIADGQAQVLFYQDEFHMRAAALDGSGLYVAGNPQPLGVGAVAQAAQFLDGDVVALAFLDTRISEIAEHEQDDDRGAAELQIFAGFTRHK